MQYRGGIMKIDKKATATLFRAFCDENRLEIIELLTAGEHCACELLEKLQISQSTLSHHMKILVDSGVVKSFKTGKWTHYMLDPQGLEKAGKLMKLLSITETRIPICNQHKEEKAITQ